MTLLALNLAPVYLVDPKEGADEEALRAAQQEMVWRTCAQGRCRAVKVLTTSEARALRAGERMVLAYQRFGAPQPVRFALSLDGTDAGLAALSGR